MRTQHAVGAGVACLVTAQEPREDRGRLLCVERRGSHGAGTWSVPGGWMECGETPGKAALRELKEETGLVGDRTYVAGWTNDIHPEGVHGVTFYVVVHLHPDSVGKPPEVREPNKAWQIKWLTVSQLMNRRVFLPIQNAEDKYGLERLAFGLTT